MIGRIRGDEWEGDPPTSQKLLCYVVGYVIGFGIGFCLSQAILAWAFG